MWGSASYVMVVMASIIAIVKCQPQVPCYFIFGDSISDVGNNNDLNTMAKANYRPYGVDFPGGRPTGRFSNGRNSVDQLAELLNFTEYIPPFSTARGQQILKGVNYASGAAGILRETGRNTGARISLDQQLTNHVVTIGRLVGLMPGLGLREYLGKCLYTVNIGSNDYTNNYFMPQNYISSRIYTPQQFADLLISRYNRQLRVLYLTGARKVAVFGLGQIGCTPAEIISIGTNGSLCVDKVNQATDLFNQKLIPLIDQLNTLPGARFTYIGSGSGDTGSLVVNATCCQELREDFQCKEGSTICPDRNNYVFWDGFHTTELFNILGAQAAYHAVNPNNVHPVDIKTLVST